MRPGWRGWRAWDKGSRSEAGSWEEGASEEGEGLVERSPGKRGESGGEVGEMGVGWVLLLPFAVVEEPGGASLNTCTVSVAEETQSSVEVALKLMQ